MKSCGKIPRISGKIPRFAPFEHLRKQSAGRGAEDIFPLTGAVRVALGSSDERLSPLRTVFGGGSLESIGKVVANHAQSGLQKHGKAHPCEIRE